MILGAIEAVDERVDEADHPDRHEVGVVWVGVHHRVGLVPECQHEPGDVLEFGSPREQIPECRSGLSRIDRGEQFADPYRVVLDEFMRLRHLLARAGARLLRGTRLVPDAVPEGVVVERHPQRPAIPRPDDVGELGQRRRRVEVEPLVEDEYLFGDAVRELGGEFHQQRIEGVERILADLGRRLAVQGAEDRLPRFRHDFTAGGRAHFRPDPAQIGDHLHVAREETVRGG